MQLGKTTVEKLPTSSTWNNLIFELQSGRIGMLSDTELNSVIAAPHG